MIVSLNNLSIEQLKQIASKLANTLKAGSVIALTGDLGSGKTTFSGLIINQLLPKPMLVTSPTFTLVNIYSYKSGNIWHFDLYRLKAREEIISLGIEEAFNEAISIIEWPEIVLNMLPLNTIHINLSFAKNEDLRNITISNTQLDLK